MVSEHILKINSRSKYNFQGGAQNRSKSSILKPKKRKKPRTRKGMLLGSGNRVDGASLDTDKSNDPNSTFKKRASSNAARQLRLDAVEKRLSMVIIYLPFSVYILMNFFSFRFNQNKCLIKMKDLQLRMKKIMKSLTVID